MCAAMAVTHYLVFHAVLKLQPGDGQAACCAVAGLCAACQLGEHHTQHSWPVVRADGLGSRLQTSEAEMVRKEHAASSTVSTAAAAASEEILYKIDIPANRYDMLCLEGIARALNIFRGTTSTPRFTLADMSGKAVQQMTVEKETVLIRPFAVAAVLRGVNFDRTNYESFIDLQDKLHQNLCRQRSLVAIGTHDLDTLQVCGALSLCLSVALQSTGSAIARISLLSEVSSHSRWSCLDARCPQRWPTLASSVGSWHTGS